MKRFFKNLIIVFVINLIIISTFVAIFIYITEIRITNVAEFVNEKNNYKVVFQAVGEPEWPFGKTKVKITLVDSNNKRIKSFEEYISDDGAVAREENIKVNWYDDYVEIVLIGEEQEDDVHELKYLPIFVLYYFFSSIILPSCI